MPTPWGPVPFPVPGPVDPISVPVPSPSDWIKDHYNPDNWVVTAWDYWSEALDDADEDAPAVPDTCEEPPETCKDLGVRECWDFPEHYEFDSSTTAFNSLQSKTSTTLKWGHERTSTDGPCIGTGWHKAVLNAETGKEYEASVVGCPCCVDGPGGPELEEIWGIL